MQRERAELAHDSDLGHASVQDAGETESAGPGPRFTARGSIPAVATDHAAPTRPSASELAYGGHEDAIRTAAAHAATSVAAPDATKEPFLTGDIMYEQLAHRFAYRDSLSAEDRAWLANQGLEARPVIHGRHGLAMIQFVPLPGFEDRRRPILAFRGTNDASDVLDDLDPHGVGASQMAANEGTIGKALVELEAWGKGPAVTGHSLGGALAQMAAARFPDLVAKVVTFQSPGIPKKMASRVDGEKIFSHHYQVKGDVVGTAGEALTPGQVSEIERPTGYLVKHTGYVTDYASQNPDKETNVDAKDRKVGKSEGLRAGVGKFLGALQKLTHTGDGDYIEVWEKVRDAVDHDAKPAELRSLIDHSKLSGDDKKYMQEQLALTVSAHGYENHHAPETDRNAE